MALIFILPREEGSGVADFCRLLDNGLFTENGKKALLNNKKFLLVLICINNTCTLYFGNRYTMERYNVNFYKDSTEVQRGENFLHCTVNSQYLEPSIT